MKIIASNGAPKIYADANNFALSSTEVQVILSEEESNYQTIKDVYYLYQSGATVRYDRQINILSTTQPVVGTTFQSLTPSIGTVDSSGYVTRISNGNAIIKVGVKNQADGNFTFKKISVPLTVSFGQETYTGIHYLDGTLGKIMTTEFDALIAGKTFSTHVPIFTSEPAQFAEDPFVRNTNNWMAGNVALEAYSPWNNWWAQSADWAPTGLQKRCPAILITPRHVLFATHMAAQMGSEIIGSVFKWVKMDNSEVTRTITNVQHYVTASDVTIAKLDSDITTIAPFKVMPRNWQDYFSATALFPSWQCDQNHWLLVKDAQVKNGGFFTYTPTDSQRLALAKIPLVSGDSGHPAGFIIDGEMVLAGVHFGATILPFVSWPSFYDDINSSLTALGGGHQLTDIDLSGYPNFS